MVVLSSTLSTLRFALVVKVYPQMLDVTVEEERRVVPSPSVLGHQRNNKGF